MFTHVPSALPFNGCVINSQYTIRLLLIYFFKYSTIRKMYLMCFLPTTEYIVNREQFNVSKYVFVFFSNLFQLWPVIILCTDFLVLRSIKKRNIIMCNFFSTMFYYHIINDCNRWFCENTP